MKTRIASLPTQKATLLAALLMCALPMAPAHAQPGAPGQADMTVDAVQRKEVIDGVVREMNKGYVFPDLARTAEAALRQHQKRGSYDAITSAEKLSGAISEHLAAVTRDKHLRLFYREQPIAEQAFDRSPSAQQRAEQLVDMKAQNFGVERIERLPFNIGYLNLRAFAPAAEAAPTIAAAMSVLAHTDTLIIDLRKNGGGDPSTVALLASYLFDERTRLNDIYSRDGDRTEQMWSSDFVPGTRYGKDKDVYILTSKHTFSAAEDFSYALKNLKRATVVGETTGGGAHPGAMVRLNPHFAMFVPNGRSISTVTKTDWEGVGVTPAVSVRAEDAMKVAQVAALKKIAAGEKSAAKVARINARIAAVESENTDGSMAR